MKHGALAVVHQPDPGTRALQARIGQSLVQRFQPQTAGELAVVDAVASDIARMGRLEQAERAACELAKLEVRRTEADNGVLTDLAVRRMGLDQLRLRAEKLRAQQGTGTGGLDHLRGVSALVQDASQAVAQFGDVDTSSETGLEVLRLLGDLTVWQGRPQEALTKTEALLAAALDYADELRERILQREERSHACQLELAEIPDEKLVRRFDKYRSAIERSVLRRIKILRDLRDLGLDPSVLEDRQEIPTGGRGRRSSLGDV